MPASRPRRPMPARVASAHPGHALSSAASQSWSPRGTAITYGTFDLFHVGHVRLFQRIRQRYEFLIVGVSSDAFNAVKGKVSVMPHADRMELVRACRWVDLVIPETCWDQKERDIVEHGADAFVMGDDWLGKFDHLEHLCEVVYLPRTEGVSSSLLRSRAPRTGPQV